MSYIIINGKRREVETLEQITTALFEMAIAGKTCCTATDDTGADAGAVALRSLDDLLEALQVAAEVAPEVTRDADLSSLPTFGGDEPSDTNEVWSWDAERLLVGQCVSDMHIIPRGQQ